MKFLFFGGCKINHYLKQYETSTRAILAELDVELVDMEFNCCGYPIRHHNQTAAIFSAARNLSKAAKYGQNILTPCKCCFGNLKHAVFQLREDADLRRTINLLLEKEGLVWEDTVQVKHLLTVLHQDVGIPAIQAKVCNPLRTVKIAAHYGCHALRPSNVTRFDDPMAPTLFEKLVRVTGAESVSWSRRLECCGNPLWGKNDALSLHMMQKKMESAAAAGADYLCVACTYCQIQFDQVRSRSSETDARLKRNGLPSILYPQLLGLSIGLSEQQLGLTHNLVDTQGLERYCQ